MTVKVLQGGTAITFDDATQSIRSIPQSSVVIEDDRIIAILEKTDSHNIPSNAEIIDVQGKIVSPGFINTHVHSWMSVYRSIAPDVTLTQYLGGWLFQYSKDVSHFKPDDVYVSALQAYLEGLYGGVTSYVEHAHNNWASDMVAPGFDAAQDSGARVWWCYDVGHSPTFPLSEQWQALSQAAAKTTPSSLVQPGLSLDSISMMSGDKTVDHLQTVREMVEKLNLRALTVHHLGAPWPDDGHSSPLQLCNQKLHNAQCPIIFSHAPFLREDEKEALRQHDQFVSITPESECHYGHGQESGRHITQHAALGVDTNFTFSGDMLFQARLWLQTVRNASYHQTLAKGTLPKETPFPVEQGFLMATRQGGLALKRPDLGVLQVGAKADIVVFDGSSPNMLGWRNPVAAVMLHANPSDVQHVLVGGEFRKRDFKLVDGTKMEVKDVEARFVEAARRIHPLVETRPPLPQKLFGIGEMGDVETTTTIR